jgi:hypothetical protein
MNFSTFELHLVRFETIFTFFPPDVTFCPPRVVNNSREGINELLNL